MRPANEKLADQLLEAGKTEFLAHGFLGASLRDIAASLGVTTGAIYRYDPDKESIFDALVAQPADELLEAYRDVQRAFAAKPLEEQLTSLPEVSDEGQIWMVDFIYDHLDAFKLIACCSVGTRYEHYTDTLVECEEIASRVLIDRMIAAGHPIQDVDDILNHIISSTLINGMFELVRHDMPREKAQEQIDVLKAFYSAGWFKILGLPPV